MENNFTSTIKNFVIDQLENRKGENLRVYISDLDYKLTEEINVNGSVHCSTYKAEQFIKGNFEEFGYLVKLAQEEYGTILNPFLEPDKAEVWAYIEGTRILLGESEVLQEIEEENNYDEIVLTDELIDKIIEELQSKEFEITF